jgi:hypothetical protein
MEQIPAALAQILNYHPVLKLKNQQARRDIKIEKGTDTFLNNIFNGCKRHHFLGGGSGGAFVPCVA